MLEFFRRYQKFFFAVIAVVIIISFSFFGTYSAFVKSERKDFPAFHTIDGNTVHQSAFQDVINILSSEMRKDQGFSSSFFSEALLKTKVADVVLGPFLNELEEENRDRFLKEKHFVSYEHPHIPYLSAEQIWTYFAPEIPQLLRAIKEESDAKKQLDLRMQLYLAQEQFPPNYLKQILYYQQRQVSPELHDQELLQKDLSLFGYHTVQDWFGKRAIEILAQYVINVAQYAESKGYTLSQKEVEQNCIQSMEKSYQENKKNPNFLPNSLYQFIQQELRRLGVDKSRFLSAWRYIELYKRFVHELSDRVLVSPLPYKDFYKDLSQNADVYLYTLPKELQFHGDKDLELFDIYVKAVSAEEKDILSLPQKYFSVQKVSKTFPKLVEKKYKLRVKGVSRDKLEAKIGVKNTWKWQVEEENWKKLQKEFPALLKGEATNKGQRYKVLGALDPQQRFTIDSFSRKAIIDEHPEQLAEALQKAEEKEMEVRIRMKGGFLPFEGCEDHVGLMHLLDSAVLGDVAPYLTSYTQDKNHYYTISVIEKDDEARILTFKEALEDGTLEELQDELLKAFYQRTRKDKPAHFTKKNGEWKGFEEIKDDIRKVYHQELYRKLDAEISRLKKEMPASCKWKDQDDARHAVRFFTHVQKALQAVVSGSDQVDTYVRKKKDTTHFEDQWKLIRKKEHLIKKSITEPFCCDRAFSMDEQEVSSLCCSKEGSFYFFTLLKRGKQSYEELVREKVYEARGLLSEELQQAFARHFLELLKQKDTTLDNDGTRAS